MELLVVIVVIAILAAISVVAYNGIQDRARLAAKQSAISTLEKKMEAYRVVNDRYPVAPDGELADADLGGLEAQLVASTSSYDCNEYSAPDLTKQKLCVASGERGYRVFWWNDVDSVWQYRAYYDNREGYEDENNGSGDYPWGIPT